MGAVLVAARPLWIVAVTLASLATVYIRAQRWRVLLRPVGDVPLYPALSATAIGFGASAVLPFRAGEFLRPALLGRRVGVRMSAAFSSVVLERLFDMLLVIGCFLGVALGYSVLTWVIQMVVNIVTAGIFLAREDLPLGRLLRLASREAPAAGAGS